MVKAKTDVIQIISQYADVLRRQITVEKIILVGPYVSGPANEWSDIEVVVVSSDFKDMNYVERLTFLARKTEGLDNALMPRGGYTPDEYEHPEKTANMGWIKSTGRVVYRAA